MRRIIIQSGHINIETNCDVALRTGTGAPGEQDLTRRIGDALTGLLIQKGFGVTHVDANANCDPTITSQDFDFFLALHGDANVYGTGGGFITAPDPAYDAVNAESIRIAKEIEKTYFVPFTTDTGIVNHPERNNANATQYYMWMALSAKTPCTLIEMGVVQDSHDSVILADTNRVSTAIAKGICNAFGVPFDPPAPVVPPTPSTRVQDPCAALREQVGVLQENQRQLQQQITEKNTQIASLQQTIFQLQHPPKQKVAIDYLLDFFHNLGKGGT